MATRKPKNPELAQAADNLAEAAQHVGKAVSKKVDEIKSAASAELAKAKEAALKKGHMAQGKIESMLKKAEARLGKAARSAERSLDKAVRDAEKRIAAAKKAAKAKVAEAQKAVKPAPAKKAAAKKAPAKKAKSTKPSRTRVTKAARKAPVKLDAFQTKRREDLLAERSTYERQADSLQAEADQLAAEREPGDVQFDEESGEGDTLAVERERDLALSAQARAAIEEIDAALERLADGTYGTCERCGKAIPKARLEALPHAALCIDCKAGGLGRF